MHLKHMHWLLSSALRWIIPNRTCNGCGRRDDLGPRARQRMAHEATIGVADEVDMR